MYPRKASRLEQEQVYTLYVKKLYLFIYKYMD